MPVMPTLLLLGLLMSPQDPKPSKLTVPKGETKKAAADNLIPAPPPMFVPVPASTPAPIIFPGGFVPQAPPAAVPVQLPPAQIIQLRTVNRNLRRMTLEMKGVELKAGAGANLIDADNVVVFRNGPMNITEMALASDNFDRWIFNDPRSEEGRRGVLTSILAEKIQDLQMTQHVGPDAVRKLRLAGSGDIKRFFDRIEAARVEFEVVRQDYEAGRLALEELEPLATQYKTGPFGANSLFEKTLRQIGLENELENPKKK